MSIYRVARRVVAAAIIGGLAACSSESTPSTTTSADTDSAAARTYAQPGDDTALLHGESLTVTVAWDTRSMALQSLRLVPRRINK